ncbi:MAG: tRNA (N(6)-L-threonylcarbamoyladenosine(37)-C(2))-methylthiotransferase [Candidatus Altiarchaeota archaeon]
MVKISIETYGCAVNQADSEKITSELLAAGYDVGDDGDVIVVNTCTVKGPTEKKIIRRLRELEAAGKNVIVAGCLPSAQPEIVEEFSGFGFVGINGEDVTKAVSSVLTGKPYVNIQLHSSVDKQQSFRINPVVEIVPISQGCLGSCSYCITKKARGDLKSRSCDEILTQIKKGIQAGIKEVWLTAQDTGCYGLDIDSNLPELINEVSSLRGDFRVRVGMMNPNHVLGFLDELVESFQSEKVYNFLHLPLQSGCNKILREMGREYSVEDFNDIVGEFRKNEKFSISTDVIVGYPTESEEEFQETVQVIKEIQPDILNISRFWARPHTAAMELKPLAGRITKARSRIMNEVFKGIGKNRNRRWIGWKGTALVSEYKKDLCARNKSYKPIIIKSKRNLLGEEVGVEITEVTYYDLRGRII